MYFLCQCIDEAELYTGIKVPNRQHALCLSHLWVHRNQALNLLAFDGATVQREEGRERWKKRKKRKMRGRRREAGE